MILEDNFQRKLSGRGYLPIGTQSDLRLVSTEKSEPLLRKVGSLFLVAIHQI